MIGLAVRLIRIARRHALQNRELALCDLTSSFSRLESGQHLSVVLHIIALVFLGLVVGALGRLFHPGRDRMGIVMTMVIGVASVLLAGLLIGGLLGFILAVVIGVVLVALWSHVVEARREPPKWKRALHVD
jgi:uncharacterized membrane protein YeaQ/YmgE (transglycosylase-associated protein family)